ncbi:MAG: TolC family protein [Gemmatimonadetes bacterium]|nr:TolC family protein [Gemmatimonadota bacterium]
MLALLLALAAAPVADSLPTVTLRDAIARATRLDPNYIRAAGSVGSAAWARRSALTTLVLPSINLSTDYSGFSTEIFNVGIGQRARTIVTARADARYEVFTGGRRLADIRRANAELETARATEVQAIFLAALGTEADYYAVLGSRELVEVARERLRRAEEQLVVARARVVSGAVVQTDSLQVLLEVNRARVALLREDARLEVARLQLGRRVGIGGPVDAARLDTLIPPDLPITLPQAVALALEQGPEYRIARGNETAAAATLRSRTAGYSPQATVTGNLSKFGDAFFPSGIGRSSFTLSVQIPLWDNFQRELNVSRAKVARDLARATREDLERAAEADVTEAYRAHSTAVESARYAAQGVGVALENFRVQQARYRAGASTILDLLEAQSQLTEAQAELVQARYAIRLALAGLEVVVGRRFHEPEN